jgi:hypothetical protein
LEVVIATGMEGQFFAGPDDGDTLGGRDYRTDARNRRGAASGYRLLDSSYSFRPAAEEQFEILAAIKGIIQGILLVKSGQLSGGRVDGQGGSLQDDTHP